LTKLELLNSLHFDKSYVALNPYYFGNKYEEKGILIMMKVVEDSDLDLSDLDDLCFQCLNFVEHEDLIKMVLFLYDKDNVIYDYNIAGSKYKVSRSEIQTYEKVIGVTIDWGDINAEITKCFKVLP